MVVRILKTSYHDYHFVDSLRTVNILRFFFLRKSLNKLRMKYQSIQSQEKSPHSNSGGIKFFREKKNQGTNENPLSAIFRNFSNFIFRQNL